MAISAGRIYAIGSNDDVLNLVRPHTRKQNLNGAAVIPGLTDAHLHWEWLTRSLQQVKLYEVASLLEATQRVADHVRSLKPGEWVLGRGWSQDLWEGGAFPSRTDLDPVTGDHPAYFQAKSGHAAWVNSIALRIAGIDASTPDPAGGQIVRDANGEPTGVLLEHAMGLVEHCVPSPTAHDLAEQMKHTQSLALATGLTGFHDFDDPSCMRALQILREQGELRMRAVKQINQEWFKHALELGVRWNFGDDWLRIGALKLFADGALGPRTALMIEPYEGEPNNYGIGLVPKDEMLHLAGLASENGLPTAIHAIGDRAVRDVLDVFEQVRAQESARGELPSQRRHRIEHVQLIHPDDKHRLAQLGVIASMQPIHGTSDWERSDKFWGKRSYWAYNTRLQIDLGAHVAFGSDAPIEPFRPLEGLYSAVARRRPDGSPGQDGWYPELRLTLMEGLKGYTQGPAYAAGMEDRLGMLRQGYLADLLVLDQDLTTVEPEAYLRTRILATMVGGSWQHGGVD